MSVLLALALVLAQAQQPPQPIVSAQSPSPAARHVGRPVVAADVFVAGQPMTDQMVLDFIETRPGEPLSMATVRETISHLYSLGRYQEVSVDATEVPGGVRLRYDLVPIQTVAEIDFRGALGLGEGELRRALNDRFGSTPSASRAAAAAEFLQGYYSDHGYLAAAIRPSLEPGERPEEALLIFEVQSGARARIRDVEVKGDPGEPVPDFLQDIHANRGRVYQRSDIQEQLATYVRSLRQNGRYEATGTLGSHLRAVLPDGTEVVDLEVTIDRGPTIQVRFEGDPLPQNRLDELVPVEREGSVDVDMIEDSEGRIVQYLNQQGYSKASVRSTRVEREGGIEIVFTVDRGRRYRVADGLKVTGNAAVSVEEVRQRFDALDQVLDNLEDGDIFVRANLDAAAAALAGIYLQRGFARVKVESIVEELPAVNDEGRVRPGIVVIEGPRLTVGDVTFRGNATVPADALPSVAELAPGAPFYEPNVTRARDVIVREYLNRGFPDVNVEARQSPEDSRVNVEFQITEGPQTFIDHVLIVGNVNTRAEVIRRELEAENIRSGQPLSLEALFQARRRLGELALFRSIQIREIPHGESGRRDLLVTIEESPATSIGYGAGLELNARYEIDESGAERFSRLELAPRGFFEVTRRNLGGKNRSASLYTRVSLRSDPEPGGSDVFNFVDYRVIGTYREPRTFGWNADVTVSGALEQGIRSTFSFTRKGVSADVLRRLTRTLSGSVRYTFSTTRTFNLVFDDDDPDEQEQQNIDRVFPQVRLSAFSGTIAHDTRDDQIQPTRGFFVSAESSLAARSLGGEVGFVRSYLEGSAYRRLNRSGTVVLAGRVAMGLADGFPREVPQPDVEGPPLVVDDLPASVRFFAGGSSTVRGFNLDSLGSEDTLTAGGIPRGGNGLVLGNLELRVPIYGRLGGALFLDGGNVFNRVSQIDLGELRGAVGVGVRFLSPVGPLRFDVGFKLDPQEFRGVLEDRRVFHFSFGHAF